MSDPNGTATEPVLDPGVLGALHQLAARTQGDLLVRLRVLFERDIRQHLGTIRAGLRDGRADLVADGARALRGSAGNLGATLMAEPCRQLEQQARSGVLQGCDANVRQIEFEYERASAALAAVVAAERPPGPAEPLLGPDLEA